MRATTDTYNCGHNILELFDILVNLPVAKIGTERDY